jgi:hypothetical protein
MEEEEKIIDIPLIFNNNIDTNGIKNLLLIDSTVSESQLFFDSSNKDTFPIIYSYNSNRSEFIKLLEDKFTNGLERITFVFHDNKNDGKKFLNQELLFLESDIQEDVNICSTNTYSPNIKFLIDISKNFGVKNIDFLACNTLNYQNWVKFYNLLSKETGVIVGASNTKTGNLKYGGNWIMENTNENIVNTYFNSNIENYKSTLSGTVLSTSTTITQSLINSYTWPVTVNGGTSTNPVIITFGENISITTVSQYFITGSSYITYDGAGRTVTINTVTAYFGLIQNGTISANGFSNVTVQNINNATINSTLYTTSVTFGTGVFTVGCGWICQFYFGNGVSNVLINNCSNSGAINGFNCGGICGSLAGFNSGGNILITNCSNSGTITTNSIGGICGSMIGFNYGIASITNCSNTGTISGGNSGGGGGICGSNAGDTYGNVTVTNCFNTGAITGIRVGGICGSASGNGYGTVSVTNCYNTAAISNDDAGGICGFTTGRANGNITITNCYNTGTISGTRAGGITGGNTSIFCDVSGFGNVTITNCYNSGVISTNSGGGICGGNSGNFTNSGNIVITKCYNTGIISGTFSGGFTGIWFGFNSNKLCSITNCYNNGAISGSNAGGFTGASIGYNNSSTYTPNILIQNCYSLGSIANTCGGICGGTTGSTYNKSPIVNIINCYTSYNSIINSGSEYISTSLPSTVRNAIINRLTNVYTSLISSWSDSAANSALTGAPTSLYSNNPGTTWTTIAINTPYISSSFNSPLYSPSSVNNTTPNYTSSAGLFTSGFNYNLISVNNAVPPNYISINSTSGVLTFSNLPAGNLYTNEIFCSQGTSPLYYGYNFNTFSINQISPSIVTWNPPTTTFSYGTAFTSQNLNASGNGGPGTYEYSYVNSSGITISVNASTILPAGSISVNVLYTPTSISYTPSSTSVTFTVNKVNLIITPVPQTIVYGSTTPINYTSTYNSFVNGETPSVLTGTLTYIVRNSSGIDITNSLSTQNAGGLYTISNSGQSSSNYNIIYATSLLTITKAPTTLNNSQIPSYIYGTGLIQNTLNLTVTPNIPGTFTYQYNNSSGTLIPDNTILDAGTYNIYQLFTPNDSINYSSSNRTTPLTVNKKQLSIIADSKTIIYGVSSVAYTSTYIGFIPGQDPSNLSGTLIYVITNSSGVVITDLSTVNTGIYTISNSGQTSNNYNITFVSGLLTINRKSLSVNINSQIMIYGGSVPIFTSSYVGFVYNQTPDVLTGTLLYIVTNQFGSVVTDTLTQQNVGNQYTISASGLSSPNYNIIYNPANLTINPTPLTLTANSGQSMIYGGVVPTFTSTYNGFVNNQGPSVLTGSIIYTVTNSIGVNVTSILPQQNVNDTYTIFVSGVSSNNYTITFISALFTINPTPLTLTANPGQSMIYGGTVPAFTSTYTGFVNNQGPSVLTGSIIYIVTNSAGVNVTNTLSQQNVNNTYTLSVSGVSSFNYTISFVSALFIINTAPLILTVNSGQSIVYGTSPPYTFLSTYSGFVNGDTSANLTGTLLYIVSNSSGVNVTNTLQTQNVGSYTLSVSGVSSFNYTITFNSSVFSITLKQLLISANNNNIIYGDNLPTLTSTITGFVNNQDQSNLNGSLSYIITNQSGVNVTNTISTQNVGNYTITVSIGTLQSINYSFNIIEPNAIFTIDKKNLYITADNKSMTYTDTVLPTLTATYNGFVNNQGPSVLIGTLDYTIKNNGGVIIPYNTLSTQNAGIYFIYLSGLSSNNYNIIYNNGELIINKASPTLTYSFGTTLYFYGETFGQINGTGATATFKSNPLPGTFVYRVNSVVGQVLSDSTVLNVNSYNIYAIFTPADINNFKIVDTYAVLNIYKQTIILSATNTSMSYGQNPPPELKFSISGTFTGNVSFLNQICKFTITDSLGRIIEYNNLSFTNSGNYTITLSLTNISFTDYTIIIQQPNAILTINKVNLYVTPENKNMIYGSQPPTLTSIYVGFVNNENYLFLQGELVYQITDSSTPPNIIPLEDLPKQNIGIYFITIIGSTLSSINYNIIISTSSSNLSIDKSILYVSPDNKTIIYGYSAPLFTSTYTGFLNGDTVSVVSGTLLYTFFDSKMNPINLNNVSELDTGIYTIVINKNTVTALNYDIRILNKTAFFSIQEKLLFIFPDNKTMVYGSNPPLLTFTCEGFINGDTQQSSLTGSVIYNIYDSKYNSINYNNLEIVKVGIYNIQLFLSTLSSIDYNIQISNPLAVLLITKRNLTINLNSLSIIYGTMPVFTSSYVGFVNGDTPKTSLQGSLSYIVTDLLLNIIPDNELSNLEVGSYFVNLFQGTLTSNNYEINIGINNTQFTVTKKILQIYPDNKTITYGSTIPTLTSTYTGFINGQNIYNSDLTGNLIYIVRDSSGKIIDIIKDKIYDAGTYTITLLIGTLKSNNYNLVIGPNTSTLIINPLTPQIIYNLPIKTYNYGIGFPIENLNAYVTYNGTDITNNGTITYKLNSINGSILTSSTILNAGNYTVYAIFISNNLDYSSVNTSNKFTVNKITPTIIYKIPEELKTMVYGTKFSKEQFNAYLTYNNQIISPGVIVYKLQLSSQQIITTNDYPLITTKKIYAQFISNNINYNNTSTFDTINVVYSNNNSGNNNNGNNDNNNNLIKIYSNGVWYYFNPKTKYYTKI